MACLGDLPEVKTLYRIFEIKLARMRLIACRGSSAEEYATLKNDLQTIYDRIMVMAGQAN